MHKIKSAFTLIELLVVITIIAIIASIGVANLMIAQKQARDSARREIISNIQSAYEQYFAEYGLYPVAPGEGAAFESGTKPKDPRDPSTSLTWGTSSSATYCICATLELSSGNANAPAGSTCNWADSGNYYCAQNKQ